MLFYIIYFERRFRYKHCPVKERAEKKIKKGREKGRKLHKRTRGIRGFLLPIVLSFNRERE